MNDELKFRREIAEVFRLAAERLALTSREYLRDQKKYRYICRAIEAAVRDTPGYWPASWEAQWVVEARLGASSCVEGWLVERGYTKESGFSAKVQRYRKAWCLELAKEFES